MAVTLCFSGNLAEAEEWEVTTATVTELTRFSGNTGAFWGYHQPIIVRAGSRVYAGLLEPWSEDHSQQWGLFEQSADGWARVYSSSQSRLLNQPPILLVDDQERLHAFVWLDGVCNHLRFDPTSTLDTPFEELPDVGYDDLWPYAGGAANSAGDVLVVPSSYPSHRYGLLSRDTDTWQQGTAVEFALRPESPSNYDRHAYPFVALNGRETHIFSTQDVNDAEKIAAGDDFTYSFRTLEYYYSPDLLTAPFEAVTIVDVEETKGWSHNDDMLVDQAGRVHILYRYQEREESGSGSPLMHAFGQPGGPFTHVAFTPDIWSDEGRLWEAPNGVLFVIRVDSGEGLVAERIGEDGQRSGDAMSLEVYPEANDYTAHRVFLVPSRASAGGAPFLEGLYQSGSLGDRTAVSYFRATLPELHADVNGDGVVEFGDFLLFAKSYGKTRGESGYDPAADANADKRVDFSDFLIFAHGYRVATE